MLIIESPAKLNLTLRILGKRPDGYHELVTLFHRISLKDSLRLEKRKKGIRIFCSHPRVPKKNNLIVRAFYLLKAHRPFQGGVTVRLIKRIPVGGGLGGGSSNAASFLLAMNRLHRLGLGKSELVRLGAKLGSDVPFFLSRHRHAVGRGRGERLRPFPFRRKLWFILFPARTGLSTRKVYQGFRLSERAVSLTRARRDVRIGSAFLEKGEPDRAFDFFLNDLWKSATRIRPSLRKTRETLSDLHLGTCQMSGSGPTHFVTLTSRKQALKAFRKISRHKLPQKPILCHSY